MILLYRPTDTIEVESDFKIGDVYSVEGWYSYYRLIYHDWYVKNGSIIASHNIFLNKDDQEYHSYNFYPLNMSFGSREEVERYIKLSAFV